MCEDLDQVDIPSRLQHCTNGLCTESSHTHLKLDRFDHTCLNLSLLYSEFLNTWLHSFEHNFVLRFHICRHVFWCILFCIFSFIKIIFPYGEVLYSCQFGSFSLLVWTSLILRPTLSPLGGLRLLNTFTIIFCFRIFLKSMFSTVVVDSDSASAYLSFCCVYFFVLGFFGVFKMDEETTPMVCD